MVKLKKGIIIISVISIILYPIIGHIFNFILEAISQHFDIYFINKMLSALEAQDALNGRDSIYKETLNGIINSPIWGNGISHFGDFSGGYPHNLFLQLMYEGGLILLIPFIILILRSIKIMLFRNIKIEIRIFVIFLFCTSVMQLLFSSTYWESQIFWFLIGTTIKVCYSKSKLSYYETSMTKSISPKRI